jgi:hypothetical protein
MSPLTAAHRADGRLNYPTSCSYGLCAWRLGKFEEAGRIFDRMLWLNPTDNQGVRFVVEEVRTRTAWVDRPEGN